MGRHAVGRHGLRWRLAGWPWAARRGRAASASRPLESAGSVRAIPTGPRVVLGFADGSSRVVEAAAGGAGSVADLVALAARLAARGADPGAGRPDGSGGSR